MLQVILIAVATAWLPQPPDSTSQISELQRENKRLQKVLDRLHAQTVTLERERDDWKARAEEMAADNRRLRSQIAVGEVAATRRACGRAVEDFVRAIPPRLEAMGFDAPERAGMLEILRRIMDDWLNSGKTPEKTALFSQPVDMLQQHLERMARDYAAAVKEIDSRARKMREVRQERADAAERGMMPLTPENLIEVLDTPDRARKALIISRVVGRTVRWSGEVLAVDGNATNDYHVVLYCGGLLATLRLAGKGACETPKVGHELHFVGDVDAVSGETWSGIAVGVKRVVASHDAMRIFPLERKFRTP